MRTTEEYLSILRDKKEYLFRKRESIVGTRMEKSIKKDLIYV